MTTARTLGRLPDDAAARWGDREALVFKDRRISFRQLAAEIDRVAKGLIHRGVAPGEKVVIWLTNCRGRIASFKIPRAVIFLDALPVTPSGKIQKAQLRERALQTLGVPRTDAG